MTTICLIRHGETDWNAARRIQGRTDIMLNEKGKQQAKQCGNYFSGTDADVMIVSPLKRARQTAEIINEKLQLPIVIMDEFIERCFGEAEGMTYEERKEQFPSHNIPGYESDKILIERIKIGLSTIHYQYPYKKVLLVAHGAVIGTLLNHYSKGEIHQKRDRLLNGCINTITLKKKDWLIKEYNITHHLYD